tara:strand:+ start:2546 stop:3052 length:507 start_codon:yes stop_codon:yes gene_type:complete
MLEVTLDEVRQIEGIHVGFTGTRDGMTNEQIVNVARKLEEFKDFYIHDNLRKGALCFHHGDCMGADFQAHGIARNLHYNVIIHPPENDKARQFCVGDMILPELPYIKRNHNIVEMSKYMIGTPKEDIEQLHGGTWATIRYARKNEIFASKSEYNELFIVLPAGQVIFG